MREKRSKDVVAINRKEKFLPKDFLELTEISLKNRFSEMQTQSEWISYLKT